MSFSAMSDRRIPKALKKVFMKKVLFLMISVVTNLLFAQNNTEFYSGAADEHIVQFQAYIKTSLKSIDQVQNLSQSKKNEFIESGIKPTVQFLFGPLTYRQWGGEQKGAQITVRWKQAELRGTNVFIPYDYQGQWLLSKKISQKKIFELPLPYNIESLRTPKWTSCTDSGSDHSDWSFFWYYWDPTRYNCDHKEGKEYQIIRPVILDKTVQTEKTYPEYEKMSADGVLSMTFGFGYVEDPADPQPFSDSDYGMTEFRRMLDSTRKLVLNLNAVETDIRQNEYVRHTQSNNVIGKKFSFSKDGIQYEIKIISSGRVDQMEIFAKSFAQDHDDFFGWFGHSRVGNGFDAGQFSMIMKRNPDQFSISQNHQLIYWAGCNSYSYYTKPFFDFKINIFNNDFKGTKGLDIISNGLPSYFSLNAKNAVVLLQAFLKYPNKTSYQEIVNQIEAQSKMMGIDVLVNVLGDEDN